jgi:2-keto-4-pentenoate hydratase/2-oxohepta-3-ene-1,7-dioic acid hydratase in catechol pathway
MEHFQSRVNFIWSVADLLRGDYKPFEYADVVLPFVVLRRLDCVLEPTKPAVLERHSFLAGRVDNLQDALAHVAGYVVVNDVSARDWQKEGGGSQWCRGKSFDTFCPTGPALVTADEIEWGRPLKMRTEVNGEVRQDSDTSDLYFGIEALVSYCSRGMTLFPGDIIVTGSPAGVAFFMKPPRFLRPGDKVRCEIEHVGAIENLIREEKR